jgi:hypothetical protein
MKFLFIEVIFKINVLAETKFKKPWKKKCEHEENIKSVNSYINQITRCFECLYYNLFCERQIFDEI